MENIWLALIVAIPTLASPLLMAWLTNRNRRIEKEQDWARQDQVALKVQEAAALLLASNQKLDVIHTLVNSNMTSAMQAELDATTRELAMMREVVELKKVAGHEATVESLAAIETTKRKIGELQAALSDRLKSSA